MQRTHTAKPATAPSAASPAAQGRGFGPARQASPVQRSGAGIDLTHLVDPPPSDQPGDVHAAARQGVRAPAGPLPFLGAIQRAFGRHAVDGVRAHTGPAASASARAMGAAAFTQGEHVVFGGGADLRTAAHEAAHVVQQRAGVSVPGGVGRIGDPYERHAEAVAERVAAGGSAEALLDQAPGGGAGGPVVQRAVGFEFETGWKVYREVPAEEEKSEEPAPPRQVPLRKKERVVQGDLGGFNVEADEAGSESEIEFVVHPPIPEKPDQVEHLDAVMGGVETFVGGLKAAAGGGPFPVSNVTGKPADQAVFVVPGDAAMAAGPQVTSGVDLAKIPSAMSHKGAGDMAPPELQPSLGQLEGTAGEIRENVGGNPSPQLLGLLTLIYNYLDAGRMRGNPDALDEGTRHGVALSYPKQIGDVLLARTQFGRLFTLLPPEEQKYYHDHPKAWLDLVRQSMGGVISEQGLLEPVIERGVRRDDTGRDSLAVDPAGPRRVEWLTGIIENVDPLARMQGGESMGELGNRTEGVSGGGRVEAGIFEFRGAQRKKIAATEWKRFALQTFRYLLTLHDQSLPIPIPKKKKE